MKTIISGAMTQRERISAAMKSLLNKKHRMMTNHNVHVITHHGKMMIGRKGRKV